MLLSMPMYAAEAANAAVTRFPQPANRSTPVRSAFVLFFGAEF